MEEKLQFGTKALVWDKNFSQDESFGLRPKLKLGQKVKYAKVQFRQKFKYGTKSLVWDRNLVWGKKFSLGQKLQFETNILSQSCS